MIVNVTRVRRMPYSVGWGKGFNGKGHEVEFVMGWSRLRGVADDIAHGDEVLLIVPAATIVSVKNPRMRRTA